MRCRRRIVPVFWLLRERFEVFHCVEATRCIEAITLVAVKKVVWLHYAIEWLHHLIVSAKASGFGTFHPSVYFSIHSSIRCVYPFVQTDLVMISHEQLGQSQ